MRSTRGCPLLASQTALVLALSTLAGAALFASATAGCEQLIGLDNPSVATGGGGSGGAPSTGGGGSGGAGAGMLCQPGTKKACAYSGEPATKNVGACKAAEQTCDADGTSYGPCEGEVLPTTEVCHNDVDEDCDGNPCAAPLWSHLWGDVGDQRVRDLAVDGNGHASILGDFEGTLEFDKPLVALTPEGFLVALDPAGEAVWSQQTVEAVSDVLSARQDGAIAIAGASGGALTISLLDDTGTGQWSRMFSGAIAISATDVAFDGDGNPLVTGSFVGGFSMDGHPLSGAGSGDVFLAQLSPGDGMTSSATSFGTMVPEAGGAVADSPAGFVVVSGTYSGTVLGCPGTKGVQTFVPQKCFSGEVFDHRMIVDDSGAIVLVGRGADMLIPFDEKPALAGEADLFLVKISAAGDLVWARSIGGVGLTAVPDVFASRASVAVDSKRNLVVTFRGKGVASVAGRDLGAPNVVNELLIKLDSDGNVIWTKVLGPLGESGHCIVATAPNDDVLWACDAEVMNLDVGAGMLSGKGALDLIVARFAP